MAAKQVVEFNLLLLLFPTAKWRHARIDLLMVMLRTEWELGLVYNSWLHIKPCTVVVTRNHCLNVYDSSPNLWNGSRPNSWKRCLLGHWYFLIYAVGRRIFFPQVQVDETEKK